MATPVLIPVSPQAQAPQAKRGSSSVPSSPNSKNPALRSSKGSFSAAPSPRRAPLANSSSSACPSPASGTPRKAPSCACSCASAHAHAAASILQSQYNNCKPKAGPSAALTTLTALARVLVVLSVLLLSNYLGHVQPLLWSPKERAQALTALATSSPFAPGGAQGAHGQALRGARLLQEAGPGAKAGAETEALVQGASPAALSEDYKHPDSADRRAGAAQAVGASLEGEFGMSDDALLARDPSAAEAQEFSLDQLGAADHEQQENSREGAAAAAAVAAAAVAMQAVGPLPTLGAGSSPYVQPWRVSLWGARSCRKIFPRHLVKPSQGPIGFVGDLLRKNQRLLLVIPRHGLGNSLRGYVSSFVYAALSGRRLVRFHGAEHAKVFDTLCHAFQCGFDAIEAARVTEESDYEVGKSPEVSLDRQLGMLNPVDFNSKYRNSLSVLTSLRSTWTLFVTKSPHFFDGFWHNFPQVRQCIYDAFGCSSAWCVRSRAMQALVGAPTPLLEDVVRSVLKQHVGPGKADVPAKRNIYDMFDIALHFRTRPAAIESKHPGGQSRQALMRIGCGKEESDEASQYLKGCLWDCLGGIMEQLDAKRAEKGRPLQILLATDNEQLRPAFVERLSKYGTIFYSSGVIVHSSKSASDEAERLPTMAEFHLMSRSHTILEAGSYVSTFAYFSGLLGNGTLAAIDWQASGGCGLKYIHKAESPRQQHTAS